MKMIILIMEIMKRFSLNQNLGLKFQTHIFYQSFFLWENKQVIFIFHKNFQLTLKISSLSKHFSISFSKLFQLH
jgi:hypothetical protein